MHPGDAIIAHEPRKAYLKHRQPYSKEENIVDVRMNRFGTTSDSSYTDLRPYHALSRTRVGYSGWPRIEVLLGSNGSIGNIVA